MDHMPDQVKDCNVYSCLAKSTALVVLGGSGQGKTKYFSILSDTKL
jgi:ABC-type transporter Mla maintaining outer membrane lipid asymmetry ATPase subunit MlaF